MAKKFKKHMMYGDGKEKMANTHKEHLKLKAKGWGHTKPKDSPLDLNQTLVRGAGQSNKQLGGSSSLSAGDWKGELITKPIMDALVGKKLTEEEQKAANNTKKKEIIKPKTEVVKGCMDPDANNHNPDATEDDGSCEYTKTPGPNVIVDDIIPIAIDKKKDKKKKDDVKNTKQKQKNVGVINVSKKKRNAIQRLFSKDKSRYKKALGYDARRAVNDKMRKYVKEGGSKDDKAYKDLQSKRDENFYRLKRKGLFNDKTLSRKEMDDYIAKNNLTRKNNSSRYEGDYYSPLEMNSREKVLRKRSSNSNSYTPFAYKERVGDSTPFYQIEKVKQSRAMANEIPKVKLPKVDVEGNVFDLINQYGDLKVGKAVDNMQLIGDEKPPQLLGAPAVSAISDFMQLQKEELFKMKDGVGNASRDRENIISNAKSLSANMNKIGGWLSENIESISEETESKGSSVANTYLRDILITKKTDEEGKPLTTMIVDNNNDLAIKFRDIAETYNLDSINENIFPKSFKTFETLSTAMRSTMDEAIAGLPFNEEGAKALINNALKTQEEILSTIHDEESPLHKILEDFANAYPNANMDFFHIDSPYFNLDDVKPIVKDYALKKLRSQHALYSKGKVASQTMTNDEIISKYSK
tara:strand:- start:9010 stop:10920 length:1911 start_codon:yes stop_codon:yes gene_type:complete